MRLNLKTILPPLICLLLSVAIASAQSGRKQKKSDPQPPVQGVNQPETRVTPEPESTQEKPKDKGPQKTIMIMTSMPDMAIPLYYVDGARQGCLSELRENLKTVDLRESRNQTRSDAIKTAKEDERTYVVLIDTEYDRMGSSGSSIDLRYTIFEPKTGKVLGTGSGYPSQPSGRMPVPPVGGSRDQIYVELMGRDIARQVMKKLGLVP